LVLIPAFALSAFSSVTFEGRPAKSSPEEQLLL